MSRSQTEGGKHRPLLAAAALIGLAAGGCVAYHEKPLTPEATAAALAVPPAAALRLDSERLRHPALPPVVVDLSNGLSADEAAVVAVLLNPDLRAERDRLALADAQVLEAGILPNPQLDYGRDFPVSTGPDLVTGFIAGITQSITEMITRHRRREAARAERESVVLEVAWREWQTAEAAKTALYGIVALERRERDVSEADERTEGSVARVRRAVDAGQLTAADLAAAEGAREEARVALLEVRGALAAARLELDRLLGFPPSADVAPEAGIVLPESAGPIPEADLTARLEDRRLDLQALRQAYASQEAGLHAAVLAQFPRLSLGINRARDTTDVTTNGVTLALDLPLFDRNQSRIAAATASRQQVFDEYASRLFEARSEVAAATADLRSLEARLRAQTESEKAFRALEERYGTALDRSQVTVLDYVTAWNIYQGSMARGFALREELLQARLRLELASGLYDVASGGEGAGQR